MPQAPQPNQLIDIPFATGVRQKTDQRWLQVGAQSSVINAIWEKQNTIQKRPGIVGFSKIDLNAGPLFPNMTVGRKLLSYKNELGIIDGQYVRELSATLGQPAGRHVISPCVAFRDNIVQSSGQITDPDIAEANGYRVLVWVDNSFTNQFIFYVVMDTVSGAIVSQGPIAPVNTNPSCNRPKLVAVGTTIICVYAITSGGAINNLAARSLNVASVPTSWGPQTILKTDRVVNSPIDVATVTGGSSFVVGYVYTGANPALRLLRYDAGFNLLASGAVTGANTTLVESIGIRADSNISGKCWVTWSTGSGDVTLSQHSVVTLTQSVTTTVQAAGATNWGIFTGVEQLDSAHAIVMMSDAKNVQWAVVDSVGAITLSLVTGWNCAPLTRPFAVASQDSVYGVRIYSLCLIPSTGQTTQELVEFSVRPADVFAPNACATIAPRFSLSSATNSLSLRAEGILANVTNIGTPTATSFVCPGTTAESLGVNGRNLVSQITFDFANSGLYACAELGDSVYVSCGVPSVYDGTNMVECGSIYATDMGGLPATITPGAGGSLQTNVTYSWVFVPEWHDARGQRHQGQPSLPVSVAMGANTKVSFAIPTITLTRKVDAYNSNGYSFAMMVPYRTAYVNGAMSTVYYRVINDDGTYPGSSGGFSDSPWFPGNRLAHFVDDGAGRMSDTNISKTELLPTTGGVVESDAPPSFITLASHQNRIFGVGDDRRTIWYSTEYVPGQVVRFNDLFTLVVEDGGPITALASLDDKLVVFKADRIYYYQGQGPNEQATGSNFAGPFRVTGDVGCTDPRSVVAYPGGVFFRSRIGLSVLDRSANMQSGIGDAVEDWISQNPVVVASALHPTRPEIWFSCVPSPGTSPTTGVVLCYNYRFDAWSQLQFRDSDQSRLSAAMISLCASNGIMYMMTPFGKIYQEYPLSTAQGLTNGFGDDGHNFVTTSFESAWLKTNGIEGYGRIKALHVTSVPLDPSDITVSIAYDYSPTYAQNVSFTSTQESNRSTSQNQWEIRTSTQKCEAVRVKISDAIGSGTPSATLQGSQFVALSGEVRPKEGPRRVPSTQRGS